MGSGHGEHLVIKDVGNKAHSSKLKAEREKIEDKRSEFNRDDLNHQNHLNELNDPNEHEMGSDHGEGLVVMDVG